MATQTAPRSRTAARPTPASEPLIKPAPVTSAATRPAPAASAPALPLALVVDDEPAVRMLIGRLLARRGWAVREEADAASALIAAEARRPNLVVTDYEMPSLSGYELAARLRALDAGLPIMMVSGYPEAAARILALPGGHTAFAVKPFAPEDLMARIEDLVRTA